MEQNKSIKLTLAMKDIIRSARNGAIITSEGKNSTSYFLETESNIKKIHFMTWYFMKRKGLIEYIKTDEGGFWGTKKIHELTELGKTINID